LKKSFETLEIDLDRYYTLKFSFSQDDKRSMEQEDLHISTMDDDFVTYIMAWIIKFSTPKYVVENIQEIMIFVSNYLKTKKILNKLNRFTKFTHLEYFHKNNLEVLFEIFYCFPVPQFLHCIPKLRIKLSGKSIHVSNIKDETTAIGIMLETNIFDMETLIEKHFIYRSKQKSYN